MLKVLLRAVFALLGFVVFPAAAYLAASHCTKIYFEKKMIPLPFERFGVAVGAGSCLWVLAISFLVLALVSKKRRTVR